MLIVRGQKATVRLERQPFETEAALQSYIYDSPEAIPLDEISPGAKLFVLGREFPTGSGPIDVLGTDQDGHPYVIETKLYRNPDKRVVVAQVLDYAAALWNNPPTPDRLLEALRADAAKRGAGDPVERLSVFLGEEETSGEAHLTSIADALKSGDFTAVVLMDRVEERLRNLIRFLNENSQFRFVAVELDYYRHGTAEIVNPRLFGAEVRRPFGGSSEARGRWDEAAFFERLAERAAPETVRAARRYCDLFPRSALSTGVPAVRTLPVIPTSSRESRARRSSSLARATRS